MCSDVSPSIGDDVRAAFTGVFSQFRYTVSCLSYFFFPMRLARALSRASDNRMHIRPAAIIE